MTAGSVANTLAALRLLHDIDREAARSERQLQQCRARLAALDDALAGLEADLAQASAELEDRRAELRRLQRAIDEKRQALDRARARLDGVQNQRQYSAASVEYDLIRRDIRLLEDQALEVLQKVDELEARRRDLADELERARLDAEPRRAEIAAEIERIEAVLETQRGRRAEATRRVDPRTLELYNRIRRSRSDVAMAALTEDGACGHCFTAVTIQQQLEIRTFARIHRCEGCGVILYPLAESE